MKEHPILFNAEMVNAILAGKKTQTRRIIKPKKSAEGLPCNPNIPTTLSSEHLESLEIQGFLFVHTDEGLQVIPPCNYEVGDHLWVRECWATHEYSNHIKPSELQNNTRIYFKQNFQEVCKQERAIDGITPLITRWRPSIFMPRWASRIQLEITDIRIQWLHDISEEDSKAEGINCIPFFPDDGYPLCDGYTHKKDDGRCKLYPTAKQAFKNLWESINDNGSWSENPMVRVIEFQHINKL